MTNTAYEAITITNEIHTGAAFGIQHGTGHSCYIPPTVMYASGCRPGDVVQAVLIDNPSEDPDIRNRTPYLVRFIKPMVTPTQLELPLEQPSQLAQEIVAKLGGGSDATKALVEDRDEAEVPKPSRDPKAATKALQQRVYDHVEARMLEGGVWNVPSMFCDFMGDPKAKRDDNLRAYHAVQTALRRMFETERCAKWSLYTRVSNARASRDWYSCHPDKADVAEFEDE